MSRSTSFIAWLLLSLAIASWAGVGLFAYLISSLEAERIADSQASQKEATEAAQASFVHGIVSSTASARSQLDALTAVDPSALADLISTAGSSTGVNLSISNASAGNISSVDGKTTSQTFSFLATSQGSFAATMYATALLETLPVPSTIQQITFSNIPGSSGNAKSDDSWQMNAQVQVLSASNTSS